MEIVWDESYTTTVRHRHVSSRHCRIPTWHTHRKYCGIHMYLWYVRVSHNIVIQRTRNTSLLFLHWSLQKRHVRANVRIYRHTREISNDQAVKVREVCMYISHAQSICTYNLIYFIKYDSKCFFRLKNRQIPTTMY